jgi:hypothetical protein
MQQRQQLLTMKHQNVRFSYRLQVYSMLLTELELEFIIYSYYHKMHVPC